jgi:hypothetical protein
MLPWLLGRLSVRLLLARGEERGQRRLELGLRVGLASLGVEEARAVDQAAVAGTKDIRAVVAEIEPGAPLREALAARALDQLVQIASKRLLGRPREADQDSGDKAGKPRRNQPPKQELRR